MVAHSRTTLRADRLRSLNAPRPVQVAVDERGWPVAVGIGGWGLGIGSLRQGKAGTGRLPIPNPKSLTPVKEILDRWRIDDEWWRAEISRMYYHVVLQSGQILTLFHDLIAGGWFVQTTGTSLRQPEPIQVLTPTIPGASAAARPAAAVPLRRIG